jgi:RHS repeat-associated protein
LTYKNVGGIATTTQSADYDMMGWEINKTTQPNLNLNKYQKQLRIEDFGLNIDFFKYRPSDSQIGRFWGTDPLADHPNQLRFSPYVFANNDPINHIDPDGRLAISMKPTPREAARIAAHVYGGSSSSTLIGNWSVSKRDFGIIKSSEQNGLKSQVYERTASGKTEYVYATAGTENKQDALQNALQPAGLSGQYAQSLDNARTISTELSKTNSELTFVGHSLGGGEAALNAMATDRSAVTFNAAGVGAITQLIDGAFKNESKIDAHIMRTDPLNYIQNSTPLPDVNGNRKYLIPTSLPSIYNGHSIDNMVKELDKRKQ